MFLTLLPHSNAEPVYHPSPLLHLTAWEFVGFPPPGMISSSSSLHHYLIIHTSFYISIYLQSAGFRSKAAAPPLIKQSNVWGGWGGQV